MSELNISLLFTGDNNKGEYISSEQVVNIKGKHASMTNQYKTKKQIVRDFTCIQENMNIFT